MDSKEALRQSSRLAEAFDFDRAIELLMEANRASHSFDIEQELVDLRHRAFKHRNASTDGRDLAARSAEVQARIDGASDPFPSLEGRLPEVERSELTADLLRGAIKHHGCLIVRGLLDSERAKSFARDTTHALESAARFDEDPKSTPDEWYAPFHAGQYDNLSRIWARKVSTVFAGDSPRVLFELLDMFRTLGLDRMTADYFGERTSVSLQKCSVRKLHRDHLSDADGSKWHQDGRFFGENVHALNVWLAFSDAGGDSPTMDIVPRRYESFVETATDNALFDWCVGEGKVREVAGDVEIVAPSFAPGDAVFFDNMLLHTTSIAPNMNAERFNSETWFFAESTFPINSYVPISL